GQGAFADYRAAQKWTPAFAGATNSKAKSNYSVIPAKAGIHTVSKHHLRPLRFLRTLESGHP
ncbi:MAG TPA: hypothetical protein VMA53_13755, partial [Stellaceae bacterium]|nr:hypothetical protein [Stellaceae bacterium]